jgi:hypothetical protein
MNEMEGIGIGITEVLYGQLLERLGKTTRNLSTVSRCPGHQASKNSFAVKIIIIIIIYNLCP